MDILLFHRLTFTAHGYILSVLLVRFFFYSRLAHAGVAGNERADSLTSTALPLVSVEQ